MRNRPTHRLILAAILTACALPAPGALADAAETTVRASQRRAPDGSRTWELSLPGAAPFHSSPRQIVGPRVVGVPGSSTSLILWDEKSGRRSIPMYAATRDGRTIQGRIREASTTLRLKFSSFDPAIRVPAVPGALSAPASGALALVQFHAPPLPEMRAALQAAGGEVLAFLPDNAFIVRANPGARALIASMPMVRWVGPFHTAYKLEDRLIAQMAADGFLGGQQRDSAPQRIVIQCFRRGPADQATISAAVAAAGGAIVTTIPEGFLVHATLTPAQVLALAALDEVAYIDTWTPPETDMNRARAPEGSDADFIEATLGFTGQGVRGEVMDFGFRSTHNAFKSPDVILHGEEKGAGDNHGTSTFGIVFGNGAANAGGRGFLPGRAQGYFSSYLILAENFGEVSRYAHTAELTDPNGPYRAVFQSNSWGSQSSTQYTTVSAELDDILFINDIVLLNSMSNNGNNAVRPQAWAKNAVAVGGINHYNNSTRDDDAWDDGASIGPAADGRIKPDLAHFYDAVLCPTSGHDNAYTQTFGGTSAATPITAGAFGIMFQMWHEGFFDGFGGGIDVFDSRPRMSTAKALMINSAFRYDFDGPGHDLARTHQGWGMANLRTLHDAADALFIIDESQPLAPLETAAYTIRIAPGEPLLAATMVYTDPAGQPNAEVARINDLSLRLTSPDGLTYYWGNSGLLDGNWSTPGGQSNTIDTVENVFIQNPAEGDWTVEVIADEVVQDARVETPDSIDADFALIVRGGSRPSCYADFTGDGALDLFDFLAFVNAFNAGAPEADCTDDGTLDLFDFLCFVNAFNAGC
jgi:serine protease AprX